MSRSRKGSKGPGHEYWSKRPGGLGGGLLGKETKKITHRLERIEGKKLEQVPIDDVEIEYCFHCGKGFNDLYQEHFCLKCLRCPFDGNCVC